MKELSKIIQICPCYVDLKNEAGGVANGVRQLCLNISSQDVHVHLICGNRELGEIKAQPSHFVENEFLTVDIVSQGSNPLAGPTKEIERILHNIDPDCVAHIHTCFSALTEKSMKILNSRNIPYVFSPHGKLSKNMFGNWRFLKTLWWKYYAKKFILKSSGLVLLSPDENDGVPEISTEITTYIIPNGFAKVTDNSISKSESLINEPYVIFLGYLDPRKQPELLIEAFSKSKTKKSHKLIFVGPDKYGYIKTLRKYINKLSLSNDVIFYGPAYGAEKWNLLDHATCLCLPSLGEGLPHVLCEAIGAGLPTIISKECNFPEIEQNNAGIIMNDFHPGTWADAIDRVCLNEDQIKTMSDNAILMSKDYTWENISARWLEIYNKIYLAKS